MFLSELKSGESAVIIKVMGHGGFRRRILEMGFVRGQQVEAVLNAPLRDPIKYRVMGYEVSLRRSEARMIEILTPYELREQRSDLSTSPNEERLEEVINARIREINVALVGNPNSGKSSIFNALTGGHAHVGNYSGVTVGAQAGSLTYKGYTIRITDLPGTYALSAYTPEELYVRGHLMKEMPDVVINAVVASNLERNLFLTTELIDLNPKMVVALNMYDELDTYHRELFSGSAHIEQCLLDHGHLSAFRRVVDDDMLSFIQKIAENVAVRFSADETLAGHIVVICKGSVHSLII